MLPSTRLVVYATLAYMLLSLPTLAQVRSTASPPPSPTSRQAELMRQAYQAEQNRRTIDPALGSIPVERLSAIRKQLAQTSAKKRQARTGISSVTWSERGPLGFTGTLRTLVVPLGDPTGRTIWAGSSTGGLWTNPDPATPASNWLPSSDDWASKNVSAIANDPTNSVIAYAATGDPLGEGVGGGIWKTADKGQTWQRLSATIPSQAGTLMQIAFSRISGLAVTTTGLLLAGTQGGVLRSFDQGRTWQFILVPQRQIGAQPVANGNDRVTSIQLGADESVYVAMATGRLFRSNGPSATAWTEITPPSTAPYKGILTKVVPAASTGGTGQVLYAAQVADDSTSGGYTLRWLLKSTNSGQTWQAMNRPVYTDAPDLDVTLGFGDKYFTLTPSPDSAQVVYMTAYDQLYRSGNGGVSWSAGQTIGRATAFLPLLNQRTAWASDNKVYVAPTQQLVAQGRNETTHDRSNSFGGLDVSGVALKNSAGTAYRLTGSVGEPGLLETPETGPTKAIYPAYPLRPFIDQNEPNVQVAATTNGGFLTRNTTYTTAWDYYSTGWLTDDYPDVGVDYDSRNNTLFFWSDGYRKGTGIGTDPVVSRLDSGRLARPTCLKVGASPNTLFAAPINGGLYKFSNTNQPTPNLSRLDGGAFPSGSTISGIDVGATDNELIVTLSNFGVQSVWYTTNGGTTWVSKDLPAHGLPDMPVYAALFNPTNRQQVMLATELGVWSTSDITGDNPGWVLTNSPAPLIRCKQFVYRAADERVAVVTNGRGVWESDVWAVDSPVLTAGPLSATAFCAGSAFPLSFTLLNVPASQVVVRLSDATGNFGAGTIIGSGTSSPLSTTVPASLASGTGYRLRLEVASFSLVSPVSSTLTISNLNQTQAYILDRRQTTGPRFADARYVSGYVCPGDQAQLRAYLPNQPGSLSATYRWAIDGAILSGQTTATLLTGQTGTYSFTASVGSCTATSTNDFLLISVDTPAATVLNPINTSDGPICSGTFVPLGASYVGQQAAYQWFRDGVAVSGATNPVLSTTATGAYSYSLSFGMSGGGRCVATASATYLTFSRAILPPAIAVVGDVAPTLCGTELLRLYATSQVDSTNYQWLQNGQPITGKTNSFVDVGQGGSFSLRVQRGSCSAVSDPVAVSANSQLSNGFYFYGSTSLCTGETLILYAKNTSHALQWTKNNVPIAGATGFSYAVTASGNYGLRYTSGSCSGTAVSVSIVVSQSLTPALQLAEQCSSVELSTSDFPRTGTVTFSWLRNGQPISQGTQSYQTVTESGVYSLSVTNGVCGGVSKPVSISIGQPAKPTITAIGGLVRCPNSAITLQLLTGPYSYWKRNGVRLTGADSEKLVATETGVYSLVYEQGACLTESAAVSVVVGQPVSATVLGRPFIRSGQAAVVPVQFSGTGPWSFSVVGGASVVNTSQNPYSFTVAPSQSTSYSLVNVANSCGTGTGTVVRVFVNGADVSLSSWVDKRFCQPGDLITYSVRVSNAGPDLAENLTLTNRLPAGLSYAGSFSATKGDSLRYAVGNVPAGDSRTVSFQTLVNRPGTYFNAIEVSSADTPDPDSQPNTGTGDGEDDTGQASWRTADTTHFVSVSPNPNGRVLPAVAGNQPVPVANQADLSMLLSFSKRVVQTRDTIQVAMRINNRGGAATSSVQVSLTLANGTYSLDKTTWKTVSTAALVIDVGQLGINETATKTVYWLPAASGSCLAEVSRSSVTDPDSTPNNHATRPGEDDEATADIRVIR